MEKTGFLFAGQGSQYIGMGKELYDTFAESKAVFDKANEALGFDLAGLCFQGPSEELKQTVNAQPAILTVTIAAFEAFKARCAVKPDYAAGLSLGEYSALVAMGAVKFEHGVQLVRKRGQLMEEASKKFPGKMTAVIDLPREKIEEICRRSEAGIANLNAPGQVIITGNIQSVDKAKEECLKAGAKRVIDLEVSGGFHSLLMFQASGELKALLDDTMISVPRTPVISNYSAQPMHKPEQIRQNLVYQLYSSVKWEDSMRFMLGQGVSRFYEFGPGKVLRGLLRKIDLHADVKVIEKKEDILSSAQGGLKPCV